MKDRIEILYVEDNEDYVSFVKRAISKIDENVHLRAVTDGNACLEYFTKENETRSLKMILMDINLPGITGIELVKKIRQKEGMEFTPIIMFSTSDNPADVKKSYDSGANAYVVKPIGISPLVNSLKSMCDFWLGCNYSKN